MKKYLPSLLAAILVGMSVNSAYAEGQGDVDDVTMNVIDQSNPQDVTSNIQLPAQASPEAAEHVNGTADNDETASDSSSESSEAASQGTDESAANDADAAAQAAAEEDAHEDSHAAAEEQATQALQDAADAPSSTDH
ncbi:MAG: hypothetical protein P8047_05560 [Gammaproteobacteria bacterium]